MTMAIGRYIAETFALASPAFIAGLVATRSHARLRCLLARSPWRELLPFERRFGLGKASSIVLVALLLEMGAANSQSLGDCGRKIITIDFADMAITVERRDLVTYDGKDPSPFMRQCHVDRIRAKYFRLRGRISLLTRGEPRSGHAAELAAYAYAEQSPLTYRSRFILADWERIRAAYFAATGPEAVQVNERVLAIPGTLTAGFEGLPVLADCVFELGFCRVEFRANRNVTIWYHYRIGVNPFRDISEGYSRVRSYLASIGITLE